MSDVILKVENISKQYRLGLIGTGTISHDLNRWWSRVRGKEDPYLKIGDSNDRSTKGESNYVWALNNINFEVKRGEVLGIIGKNGAGKSTLLKILSRVTSPTTGEIKSKGRIASLLEVGTGFHPEMTGRENIYLNGAILGMTKVEIKQKEEEIIEFSGCQRYIDTPVKRYSSGMRVRLAFAVAAHLEPDILVVDEVLAVGDAEFQKKAIGKMQDISKGDGRTVLFVSHNMAAVEDLCTSTMIIDNGEIAFAGNTKEAINNYLGKFRLNLSPIIENTKSKAKVSEFKMLGKDYKENNVFASHEEYVFQFKIEVNEKINNPIFSLRITDVNNVNIITWRSNNMIHSPIPKNLSKNIILTIKNKNLYLLDGLYTISAGLADGKEGLNYLDKFFSFEIYPSKPSNEYYNISKNNSTNSLVFYPAQWELSYEN